MTFAVLASISAALGILRVAGVKSVLFQGIAHVFVGGLFGAYFGGRPYWFGDVQRNRPCLGLALALTALEVGCFLASRFGLLP